jgi:hypothetical protein
MARKSSKAMKPLGWGSDLTMIIGTVSGLYFADGLDNTLGIAHRETTGMGAVLAAVMLLAGTCGLVCALTVSFRLYRGRDMTALAAAGGAFFGGGLDNVVTYLEGNNTINRQFAYALFVVGTLLIAGAWSWCFTAVRHQGATGKKRTLIGSSHDAVQAGTCCNDSPTYTQDGSIWLNGSFYLLVIVIVLIGTTVLFTVTSGWESLKASMLAFALVSVGVAATLRHGDKLSEAGLLAVFEQVLCRLFGRSDRR